jgi:hypothetical protein
MHELLVLGIVPGMAGAPHGQLFDDWRQTAESERGKPKPAARQKTSREAAAKSKS